MKFHAWKKLVLMAGLSLFAGGAAAQTIKVGLVNSTSGVFATLGDQIDKSVKLYMKENAAKLPPGVKVELIVRDDGGPNPDNAKRLTQELLFAIACNFSPATSGRPTPWQWRRC